MRSPEWWEVQGEQWKFQPEPRPFQPGDKVVCINAKPDKELTGARRWGDWEGGATAGPNALVAYPRLPAEGNLYVVREVSGPEVFLVGIAAQRDAGPCVFWKREAGFAASRFMLFSEYRRQQAWLNRHGFYAQKKQMEAYEQEMDCYNKDGSLSAKGKKKYPEAAEDIKGVEP